MATTMRRLLRHLFTDRADPEEVLELLRAD